MEKEKARKMKKMCQIMDGRCSIRSQRKYKRKWKGSAGHYANTGNGLVQSTEKTGETGNKGEVLGEFARVRCFNTENSEELK